MDTKQTALELLEMLSNALTALRDSGHRGHVDAILLRLESLSVNETTLSRELRMRVLELYWEFAMADGHFVEAVDFCKRGMQVAGVDSSEYFLFVCSLMRTCLEQGEQHLAVKSFCDELSSAVKRRANGKNLMPLIRMAELFDEIDTEQSIRLRNVLQDVARSYCKDHGAAFRTEWKRGVKSAVTDLLNKMP